MLFALLLALSSPVRADAPSDPLANAWGGAPIGASWIFVLETSGPFLPLAQAARADVARLVDALPAGDRVEIIALHTRANQVLPLTTVTDGERASLAARVRALELPSAKSSDLGAGLEAVGQGLDAVAADAPAFVVVMGSFCHSPSVASAYADGGYGCRAIRGLEAMDTAFDHARDRSLVTATLLPIGVPGEAVHDDGLAAVRQFFAPAVVETSTDPLATWVGDAIDHLAQVRLRPLARAEAQRVALTATITHAPTVEEPHATVQLGSGLTHLALDVPTVTVTGASLAAAPLHLAPSADIELAVDIPPPPFSLLPAHDFVDIPVTVHLDGTLAPADALSAAGIDPARHDLSVAVTLQAERHYGLSATRAVAMLMSGVLLAAAGGLALRRRLSPLRLGGTFTWRRSGEPRRTLPIQGLSEAAIVVLPDGSLGIGRPADAMLVLRVERPLWNTHASVEIRAADVEINARPARPGRYAVVPGATSFQFREYRLSWE